MGWILASPWCLSAACNNPSGESAPKLTHRLTDVMLLQINTVEFRMHGSKNLCLFLFKTTSISSTQVICKYPRLFVSTGFKCPLYWIGRLIYAESSVTSNAQQDWATIDVCSSASQAVHLRRIRFYRPLQSPCAATNKGHGKPCDWIKTGEDNAISSRCLCMRWRHIRYRRVFLVRVCRETTHEFCFFFCVRNSPILRIYAIKN